MNLYSKKLRYIIIYLYLSGRLIYYFIYIGKIRVRKKKLKFRHQASTNTRDSGEFTDLCWGGGQMKYVQKMSILL